MRPLVDDLVQFYRQGRTKLLHNYTNSSLKRVCCAEYFSRLMSSIMHTFAKASLFLGEVQRAELDNAMSSRALATSLAGKYVGAF